MSSGANPIVREAGKYDSWGHFNPDAWQCSIDDGEESCSSCSMVFA